MYSGNLFSAFSLCLNFSMLLALSQKTRLCFCFIELTNFFTHQCSYFGIPVNTIRQRSVNGGGMTLLSLKGPACKVVLWPVFGNLAFLTFPNGYGIFPN